MIEDLNFALTVERGQIDSHDHSNVVHGVDAKVAWEYGWEEYAEGIGVLSSIDSHVELGQHKLLSIGFNLLAILCTIFAISLTPINTLLTNQVYV